MPTFAGARRENQSLAVFGQGAESGDARSPWEVLEQEPRSGGAFSRSQPIVFLPRTIASSVVRRTTFDDYYNRIWLLPALLDLGSVSNTQTSQFTIWNAYLQPLQIASIGLPSDTSLALGGASVGMAFKALQQRTALLTAAQEGDPSIAAVFTFTFDNADYATLSVIGTRARFWEFAPNWDDGVDVTFEYRSEIITSYTRKEQRIANRQTARKKLEYQSIVPQHVYRSMLGFMNSNQNRLTMVPEYSRGAHLAVEALGGSSFIEVEEAVDWLVVDHTVVLYQGGIAGYRADLRKIIAVVGNTAELGATLDGDWPTGSKVYPVVSGYLPNSISASMLNNNTARIAIALDVLPGSEPVIDYGVPEEIYDGREVFLKRPDWSGTPTVGFEAIRDQVDYGYGRIDNFFPVPFNYRTSKVTYLGRDREDAEAFIRFFHRQMGQIGEFFMPTYTEDMIMKGTAETEGFTLRVEGLSVFQAFADSDVYRHVILFFVDGTHLIRRIDTIGQISDLSGDDSVLVMTESWGEDFAAEDIVLVCWLPLWRFSSDNLIVSWVTDGVAQFAVNMTSLEYVPQE